MIELLENKPIPNHSTNVLDIQRIHSSSEKLKEFFCKFWKLTRAVVAYCITGVPLAIIWRYSSLYKQQGNIIFLYWPDEIVFIANATPSKQIAGKKEKINKKSWFLARTSLSLNISRSKLPHPYIVFRQLFVWFNNHCESYWKSQRYSKIILCYGRKDRKAFTKRVLCWFNWRGMSSTFGCSVFLLSQNSTLF